MGTRAGVVPAAAARRTCAPGVTFGRSQVSSPVLAATQPHGTAAPRPLASAPRPRRHPPERRGRRALARRARGAHRDSVPSLVLANAQITPRAAFMLARDGALPTTRYSAPAPSREHPAAARGRCVNPYTLPQSASEPTKGGATTKAWSLGARG